MRVAGCWKPWNSLYIEHTGDVFLCCHARPFVLGNIHEKNLAQIWNGAAMAKSRDMALNNKLACLKNCPLLNDIAYPAARFVRRDGPGLAQDYRQLKYLMVCFGHQCNLKCLMCKTKNDSKQTLNFDRLLSSVDFAPIKYVDIIGGEPLLIPEARKFFDFLVQRGGIKVNFITNGTIMNDELARKIAGASHTFVVSLNAATKETHEVVNRGSRWDNVMGNLKKLAFYRRQFKTKLLIHGHMTIVRENLHEIPAFIRNRRKLRLDIIDFGFDKKTVPDFLQRKPALKSLLKKKVRGALEETGTRGIMKGRLRELGLI